MVLHTAIDPRDRAYQENRGAMLARLAELDAALRAACEGGGEREVTRHHARGRLLPRERIELLLDRDSPFLELAPTAAWGTGYPVGAGVVTGIGVVEGVECVLVATDATVGGDRVNPYAAAKTRRAGEIALANGLPLISLVDPVGPEAHDALGAPVLGDLARLARARVPTIVVVFGPLGGEATHGPGGDQTILVRHPARLLPVNPATPGATGEPAGPAPVRADYLAEDERDGLRLARQCVRRLNRRRQGPPPRTALSEPPKYDAEELLGVLGAPFDVREVLARMLDGSEFDEFRPAYGTGLVAGWGEVYGYPVGVLADGRDALGVEEARKAAHFVELANAAEAPLIFFGGATGSDGAATGTDAEPGQRASIGPDGLLASAVADARVPQLGVRLRPGRGESGLRAPAARFRFAWPLEGKGSEPVGLAGRLDDDAVIDPRDTRTVLGIALSAIHNGPIAGADGSRAHRM